MYWWMALVSLAAGALALIPWRRIVARSRPRWERFQQHEISGAVIVTIVMLIAGTIPTLLDKVPLPNIHDEAAYLTQADTFAHFRLSNPTPAGWEHFQTFHVLMTPTYAAKFPPGNAMALAAGVKLHWPILGMFGALAIACGAVCWMMQTALPRAWAIACGLLVGFQPYIFSNWGQTYLSGAFAMLGGALLVGAAIRSPTLRTGIIAGIGLAVLANTRPFEGLVLAAIVFMWIAVQQSLNMKFIAGAIAILIPTALWIGFYNYRATGKWTRFPYVEHAHQYMTAPLFFWQAENRPPAISVPKLAIFHEKLEYEEYAAEKSWSGWFAKLREKAAWVFPTAFTPLAWALALPGLWWAARNRIGRLFLLVIVVAPMVHVLCTPYLRAHYFGPIAPCFFGLLTLSIYEMRRFRIAGKPFSSAVLVAIFSASVLTIILRTAQMQRDPITDSRRQIVERLTRDGGKHLVLVQYMEGRQRTYEWVYNPADFATAPVLFAHVLGVDHTRELMKQYSDRTIWLLSVRENDFQIDKAADPQR